MMEDGGLSMESTHRGGGGEGHNIKYTIALLCSRRVSTFMYSSETQYIALCYTLVIGGAQHHIHECTHSKAYQSPY